MINHPTYFSYQSTDDTTQIIQKSLPLVDFFHVEHTVKKKLRKTQSTAQDNSVFHSRITKGVNPGGPFSRQAPVAKQDNLWPALSRFYFDSKIFLSSPFIFSQTLLLFLSFSHISLTLTFRNRRKKFYIFFLSSFFNKNFSITIFKWFMISSFLFSSNNHFLGGFN